MRLITTTLLVLCMSVAFSLDSSAEQSTSVRNPISVKAGRLKLGMRRPEVIALLGPATWAKLPKDKGSDPLEPHFSLELKWRSPGCAPVVVVFDAAAKVSGWDEGRLCRKNAEIFNPTDEFACTKKDRASLCGR